MDGARLPRPRAGSGPARGSGSAGNKDCRCEAVAEYVRSVDRLHRYLDDHPERARLLVGGLFDGSLVEEDREGPGEPSEEEVDGVESVEEAPRPSRDVPGSHGRGPVVPGELAEDPRPVNLGLPPERRAPL